ncbi:uncharacterized protein LOC109989371 [Xyrichtys novacula]|nr:uncharacterized protein LOC109989371 [Xyrichtys novacula]
MDVSDGRLQSPKCGTSLPVEAGEEVDPENPGQDLDQQQDKLLQKLEDVLRELQELLPPEKYKNAECLVNWENLRMNPAETRSLLELLRYLKDLHQKARKTDDVKADNKKADDRREKKTPPSSSYRSLRPYEVKVFSKAAGRTCGADGVILEQVNGWAQFFKVEIVADFHDCDIIILFCPIVSRVGTDVDAAMRTIPGDKPVILVLMHHTRDADYSVDKYKNWSKEKKSVVLAVHVLHHETKGLLKCARNDDAVKQIRKELKNKSHYRLF